MLPIFLALGLGGTLIYIFTRQRSADGTQTLFQQAPAPVSRGSITSGGQLVSGPDAPGVDYAGAGFKLGAQGLQAATAFSPAFAASAAVPIAGIAIAAGAAIFAGIRAAHQRAVATEAKTMNAAYPVFRKLVLDVAAAWMRHQITIEQGRQLLQDGIAGYYQQVQPIIKGKWAWTGPGQSTVPPSVCNGPCVAGHFWIEGDAGLISILAPNIYNGTPTDPRTRSAQLGDYWVKIGPVPPHAGFSGAPETVISWR